VSHLRTVDDLAGADDTTMASEAIVAATMARVAIDIGVLLCSGPTSGLATHHLGSRGGRY
jgi:hypothetical protein